MMNMSYCRFENTLKALHECYAALYESSIDKLSPSERESAVQLVKLCEMFAADFHNEAKK